MSQHRKQGGAQTRLSHPFGSRHPVYDQCHTVWENGVVDTTMVVAEYNDDGSFTGWDGLRYVERLVLVQEDKRGD